MIINLYVHIIYFLKIIFFFQKINTKILNIYISIIPNNFNIIL